MESLSCNLYLNEEAPQTVHADLSVRYSVRVAGTLNNNEKLNPSPHNFLYVCIYSFIYLFIYLSQQGSTSNYPSRFVRKIQSACCWDVTIIIIIIIIIAFKGAIRDFLQSPHSAANRLQHVRSSGPGVIVCKSRATHRTLITCKCHVTCHLVRRGSSAIKFDRVEITFI